MRILLAEDDQFYAQKITDILIDQGARVDCVGTAQDALKKYSRRYNVVILDSMLPNDPNQSGLSEKETQGGFRSGISVARKLLQKDTSARLLVLSADVVGTGAAEWCAKWNIPCVAKTDGQPALLGALERLGLVSPIRTPASFVVHGHDDSTLQELKIYICEHLGWQAPIILREQPSAGRTIIEKFEFNAHRVDCVFVLLTPDDSPSRRGRDSKRRSRQNVVFELGFFYGQLRRTSGRIFLLHKGEIELPSDIQGIVSIDISSGILNSDGEIRAELRAAKLLGEGNAKSAAS